MQDNIKKAYTHKLASYWYSRPTHFLVATIKKIYIQYCSFLKGKLYLLDSYMAIVIAAFKQLPEKIKTFYSKLG